MDLLFAPSAMPCQPLRAPLARLIAVAVLALAMAYSPPSVAGFTVYLKGDPPRRLETFAEFVEFVTGIGRNRVEWVEADADMPEANIWADDINALANANVQPRSIDKSTRFGMCLYRDLHRWFLHFQDARMFTGLMPGPFEFLEPIDEATQAKWNALDDADKTLPWIAPTPRSKRTAAWMEEMRDKGITQMGPVLQDPKQTVVPRMFAAARRLVDQASLPATPRLSRWNNGSVAVIGAVDQDTMKFVGQHGSQLTPQQFDIWQYGVNLYEHTQGLPQTPWPAAGDPFAERHYGAACVLLARPLLYKPWWQRPLQFVLRSIRP